jgi:AcrR family transcriptional regulator
MTVSRQEAEEKKSERVPKDDPRANQRRRTKAAIMEGARRRLLQGKVPTVADAAEESGVSRATAYRYFPSQGALIREAVDEVLVQAWEWEKRLQGATGLVERVDRYMTQTGGLVRDNEALMRGALLLSLEQRAKLQAGEDLGEEPIKRGGRLVGIKGTLEPFEGKLDPETLRRLAIALSITVGIEARVVMRDIRDLDDEEAELVMLWMARALADAAQADGRRRRR